MISIAWVACWLAAAFLTLFLAVAEPAPTHAATGTLAIAPVAVRAACLARRDRAGGQQGGDTFWELSDERVHLPLYDGAASKHHARIAPARRERVMRLGNSEMNDCIL